MHTAQLRKQFLIRSQVPAEFGPSFLACRRDLDVRAVKKSPHRRFYRTAVLLLTRATINAAARRLFARRCNAAEPAVRFWRAGGRAGCQAAAGYG